MGKTKTLRDHASDLADSLAPHVENARDKAAPMLADARDKAGPLLADARDKAAPYVAEARDKAAPYVAEARDRIASEVLPVVTSALGSLDEATEDVRAETLRRGKAVTAALKGEIAVPEPKRKKRRGPLLLILLGLGVIGFAVARRMGDRQATTTWQSSYTPPPPASPSTAPASPAATAAPGTADPAASDPAEAAADATEAPHAVTTPDEPATEVDVDRPSS
jgi:F0F1-type ATP synthase membrane subunit b/b'